MEKAPPNYPSAVNLISISDLCLSHSLCVSGLAAAFWAARSIYYIDLISDPFRTLRHFFVIQAPIVILVFSRFRRDPEQCSYLKAMIRGVLGTFAGALVNALVAIALGAPVGLNYLPKTVYWSLLISSLTFVPAACVFGASWKDWRRLFAHTKPVDLVDYMICVPAHGAIVGSWFGAWPMPLDWERPWQEWPICVSYGTMVGYVAGMLLSFGLTVVKSEKQHLKKD
uniref:Phosphatidylinositol-glycan biosynthesis class F protein n=1 Tax=Kalanchoe fedtschenkoi TaxID=63787 RepID=A0A7N0VC70_KALFE